MNQSAKWVVGVIVVVAIVAIGYFVFKGPSQPVSTEPIKIGVTAPLTGEAARFGDGVYAGVLLAIKEINDAGGINGRKLQVVFEDDKCSKDGITTITKLVNVDKVTAIIGPVCSAAAGPGLPVAQKAGVPVIFWASAPHLTKIGDYMFRTWPSDSFHGKFTAEFIFNVLNKKKVAILYVNNDWGLGIRDVFVARFKELGGSTVYNEGVPQDAKDLRTQVTKLKASNPDVIYLPAYPAVAVIAFKEMKNQGVNVPVVGGDAFETKDVLVPEADGVLYTASKFNTPAEDFQKRVKEVSGKEYHFFSALAYDAVKILASVMERVGSDQKAIRNELANLTYTKGVSLPLINFDENGDLKAAQFEVKIIKGGKAEIYQ
jgi:branched-chain amino acid transport system substrate-binding protein